MVRREILSLEVVVEYGTRKDEKESLRKTEDGD